MNPLYTYSVTSQTVNEDGSITIVLTVVSGPMMGNTKTITGPAVACSLMIVGTTGQFSTDAFDP